MGFTQKKSRKGWFRESQRHSLARKGVRTVSFSSIEKVRQFLVGKKPVRKPLRQIRYYTPQKLKIGMIIISKTSTGWTSVGDKLKVEWIGGIKSDYSISVTNLENGKSGYVYPEDIEIAKPKAKESLKAKVSSKSQEMPLYKAIASPPITPLSDNEQASKQFLNDLEIPITRTFADLTDLERQRLTTALILKMIEHREPPRDAERKILNFIQELKDNTPEKVSTEEMSKIEVPSSVIEVARQSRRDNLNLVLDIIKSLEREYKYAKKEDILNQAERLIRRADTEQILYELRRDGHIYEPRDGAYRIA